MRLKAQDVAAVGLSRVESEGELFDAICRTLCVLLGPWVIYSLPDGVLDAVLKAVHEGARRQGALQLFLFIVSRLQLDDQRDLMEAAASAVRGLDPGALEPETLEVLMDFYQTQFYAEPEGVKEDATRLANTLVAKVKLTASLPAQELQTRGLADTVSLLRALRPWVFIQDLSAMITDALAPCLLSLLCMAVGSNAPLARELSNQCWAFWIDTISARHCERYELLQSLLAMQPDADAKTALLGERTPSDGWLLELVSLAKKDPSVELLMFLCAAGEVIPHLFCDTALALRCTRSVHNELRRKAWLYAIKCCQFCDTPTNQFCWELFRPDGPVSLCLEDPTALRLAAECVETLYYNHGYCEPPEECAAVFERFRESCASACLLPEYFGDL